jgi:hypothetical protein
MLGFSSLVHTALNTVDQTLAPRFLPNITLLPGILLEAQVLSSARLAGPTSILISIVRLEKSAFATVIHIQHMQ